MSTVNLDSKRHDTKEEKAQRADAKKALTELDSLTARNAPQWLDKEARKCWTQTINAMKRGNFKKIDLALLASYCQTYSNLIKLQKDIDERGVIVDGKKNPSVSLTASLTSELISVARQLAISPMARASVALRQAQEKPKDESDPFLKLMKQDA